MARHTLARSMHDLGLATWFGGSLMGAVGLNGAAASLRDPKERSTAATMGWSRWAPVSTVAIGAHLLGAVQLLRTEQFRVRHQDAVARSSAIKTGLTAAALGVTAYSGVLNRKMVAAGPVPVEGATEPSLATPADVASTQKQLKAVQWLIPALTGGLVATSAWQGEQMRDEQVLAGMLPSVSPPRTLRLTGAGVVAALLAGRAGTKAKRRRTGRITAVGTSTTNPAVPVTAPTRDVSLSGREMSSATDTPDTATLKTGPRRP